MKSNTAIILLSFCMVFFSCCCDCDCDNTVTYKVDGIASTSPVSVMFNNDYGNTELYNSVKLPWVYAFTIKERGKDYYGGDYDGHFPAYVSARNSNSSGSLSVTIYVGGKPVASSSTTDKKPTAEARYNVEL